MRTPENRFQCNKLAINYGEGWNSTLWNGYCCFRDISKDIYLTMSYWQKKQPAPFTFVHFICYLNSHSILVLVKFMGLDYWKMYPWKAFYIWAFLAFWRQMAIWCFFEAFFSILLSLVCQTKYLWYSSTCRSARHQNHPFML